MKWLLFTNIETDIKNNITRMRCCLTDYKFNGLVFIKDYEINTENTISFIESEIIKNLNNNVALKDIVYLICNLKSSIINDNKLISKKMLNLEKRIKETVDLSSFCILMDTYKLHNNNVNVDYCLYMIYGVKTYFNGVDDIKNDITF
jgi:hypothetical protein